MRNKRTLGITALATLLGIAHHIDHVVRRTHVGWPVTDQVTPFTYSLAFYPTILFGLYLYLTRRAGPGFWAILAGAGALAVTLTHFGPLAAEPADAILHGHRSMVAGWSALSLLIALGLTLLAAAVHDGYLWWTARSRERPQVR